MLDTLQAWTEAAQSMAWMFGSIAALVLAAWLVLAVLRALVRWLKS